MLVLSRLQTHRGPSKSEEGETQARLSGGGHLGPNPDLATSRSPAGLNQHAQAGLVCRRPLPDPAPQGPAHTQP